MFYSLTMATKTSILVEDDVWKAFQAYARKQGRSASKQMEWLMREAIASQGVSEKVVTILADSNAPVVMQSNTTSKATRKRSSG